MSAQAWDVLVRRLEVEAKRNGRNYRLRVAALAALGYAYIGAILIAVLAGVVWSLALFATGHPAALKLLIVLGILAFVILRALPVKLDPPEGVELSRGDAPELFSLVERLREALAAPPIHHLRVDGTLNACVAQVPRFGWFGPTRNYLVLGLPLLAALSEAELSAVVAHELGHVSGRHGRFAAWIYRVRQTWEQLLTRLEHAGHWGIGLFRRFFRWYAPYFSAYSFVLAREQEYEADRAAAAAVGRAAAAAALARLELVGSYLGESFWPDVYREAETSPTPTARPLAALAQRFRTGPPAEELHPFSDGALHAQTDTADTHPSLTARLTALDVMPAEALRRAATRTSPPAADRLLDASYAPLLTRLDDDWRRGIEEWWRAEHDEAGSSRTRLEELERLPADELDAEALVEKAALMQRFQGSEAALPVFRAALERDPANAVANYVVGQALLADGNETGLRHLDRTMLVEPDSILASCELAEAFLVRQGRAEEAERYRARRLEQLDVLEYASDERRSMSLRDKLREHDRPREEVSGLAEQLGRYSEVKRAYLARRVLAHLDEKYPSYVLAVQLRSWRLHHGDPVRRLAEELEAPFEFFVADVTDKRRFRRRIRKLAGAEIYRRS